MRSRAHALETFGRATWGRKSMKAQITIAIVFLGAICVTDNLSEFARVPGLKVENWLERV